jgi:hypothetical protein
LPSGHIPKAPDPEKLKAAIKEISQMTDRIAGYYGVKLEFDNSPARTTAPMRRTQA